MKKNKPLKWWQGLLIVLSVFTLAVGGVFIYLAVTNAFNSGGVYPESFSFVLPSSDDENAKNYNLENGQFEVVDDFEITFSSPTENVNKKNITLSFDKSFSGQGDNLTVEEDADGNEIKYIDNGIVRVRQTGKLDDVFEIEVLKNDEGVNVGGQVVIYAKSENNKAEVVSIKIAVDVSVEGLEIKAQDITTGEDIDDLKIIKGTNVKFSSIFTPNDSMYAFDKGVSENPRKKDVFYSATIGGTYLTFNYNDGDPYFTATGAIGSKTTITAYTFKNAQVQNNFYSQYKNYTAEALYNQAITFLSTSLEEAKSTSIEVEITDANVENFSIELNETQKNLLVNKKYVFTAGDNDEEHISLGVNVTDAKGRVQSGKFSDVAIYFDNENITVKGGASVSIDGKTYIKLKTAGSNLNNSFWEIYTSEITSNPIEAEIVLLENKGTGEAIWNNFTQTIKFTFTEPKDPAVEWSDLSDIRLTIIHSNSGNIATASPVNVKDRTNIQNCYYKSTVYLVSSSSFDVDDPATNYFNVLNTVIYNGNTYYEIDSDLLIKKAIENVNLYYATIRTDAENRPISPDGEDTIYSIVNMSSAIKLSAVDTLQAKDFTMTVYVKGTNGKNYVVSNNDIYYVPTDDGELYLEVGDDVNKELLLSEFNSGKIEFYQNNQKFTAITVFEEGILKGFKLSMKNMSFDDVSLGIEVRYNNSVNITSFGDNISNAENKSIYIYTPILSSAEMKLENGGATVEGNSFTVVQSIDVSGEFSQKWTKGSTQVDGFDKITFIAKDQHGLDLNSKQNYTYDVSKSGIVSIDAEGNINFGTTDSQEIEITIRPNYGKEIDVPVLTLKVTSTGVNKVSKYVEGNTYEIDNTKEVEVDNLSNIFVTRTGWANNEIDFSKLFKLYSNGENITSGISYQLNQSWLSKFVDEEKDMLDQMIEFNDNTNFSGITSSESISKIKILNDFGQDFTINLDIKVAGLTYSANLIIESNIASITNKLKDEDFDDGVYAQYAYDLAGTLTLKKGATPDFATENIEDETGVTVASVSSNKVTFNETIKNQEQTVTIYSLLTENNGNKYGLSFTTTLNIYVNLKLQVKDGGKSVDFANVVVNNGSSLEDNHVSLVRKKGEIGIDDKNLEYSITGSSAVKISDTSDPKIVRNGNNMLTLSDSDHVMLTVSINDSDINTVDLELRFTDFEMNNMAEMNSSWMSVKTYQEKKYLFVDLSGGTYTSPETEGNNVSASVFVNANTVYSKNGDNIVISASKVVSALDDTQNFIVEIKKTDNSIIGRISYPLLISSVGKEFVEYSTEGMNATDLRNLLDAKINEEENAYDTLSADSSLNIINNTDEDQGFKYNNDSATVKSITIKENYTDKFGVALASIEGTTLKLNHLAGSEDIYILLEITLKSIKNQKELSYVYRVKVSPTKTVEDNEYPIEEGYEFIELTENVDNEIDLSETMDNGKTRFNLSTKSTSNPDTDTSKIYIISSVVFGKDEQENTNEYEYPELSNNKTLTYRYNDTTFTIKLDGSTITFKQTGELINAQVAVQCRWEDVCEGYSQEYKFQINPGEGEVDYYYMEYTGIDGNTWSCESTKDVDQTLTVKAKYKQNDFSSEINTNEKAVTAVMKVGEIAINGTMSGDDQTFTYSKTTEIFNVNYKYKDKKLTLTVKGFVDIDYEITFNFYVGGRLAQNPLTIKLPGSIQATIKESLEGGKDYAFTDVVSGITPSGSELDEISGSADFLTIENKQITVYDLVEDKTADLTFTFSNTDGTYTVTKKITFTKNMEFKSTITIASAIANEETDGGSIFVEDTNKKGGLSAITTDSRIDKVTINDGGLLITPKSVAETTTFSVNITITYTADSYTITHTLTVVITVEPDVTPAVNYPTGLDYESYKVTPEGSVKLQATIGDIKSFLLETTAPLATRNRIVFTDSTGTTVSSDTGYTIKINDLSSAKVEFDGTEKQVGEEISGEITIIKESSVESYVEFSVTCHEVSAIYRMYLVNNDVITLAINGTTNTVTEGENQVETLYLDKQGDKKIFNGKRLVEIIINDASKLSIDELYYAILTKTGENDIVVVFKIRSDLKQDGMTFCLDAGQSVDGYSFKEIRRGSKDGTVVSGANLGFAENATLRSRVEHRYTLKDNSYKVVDGKYKIGETECTDYIVSSVTELTGLSIVSSVDDKITTTYYYRTSLDFQVEMEIENGAIIEIEAHKEYDLLKQAGIKKLSTGEYYKKEDFSGSNSITIETASNSSSVLNTTIYPNIKVEDNSTPKYLIYQPLKNGDNIYNYTLYADGASNNGSYVLLKITYKVDSTEVNKYILIKIIPDTIVKFNGGILAEAETVESVDNSLNPYVVEYKNSSYTINLAKGSTDTGASLLEIKNKNHNSNKDIAYAWTYTIITDENSDGYTYNEEPDMYNYGDSDKGWTTDSSTGKTKYTKSNSGITITRSDAILFGTKRLLVYVTNTFGYRIDLYFNLSPSNSEQPEVDVASSDRIFTEGDSFDIGVLYDLITPVAQSTISVDKIAYTGDTIKEDLSEIKNGNTIIGKYKEIGGLLYVAKGDVTSLSESNACKADYLKIGETEAESQYTISETGTRYPYELKSGTTTYYAEAQDNLLVWTDDSDSMHFAVVGPVTLVNSDTTFSASVKTESPTKGNIENLKIVNLSGINAWGFSAESYKPDITGKLSENPEVFKFDQDLLDLNQLTLNYIKVTGIDFLDSNGKSVGFISKEFDNGFDLATSDTLKWAGSTSGITYRNPAEKYTIPTLDGDVYMANSAPTITMKITLTYKKTEDGNTKTETCEILYNIVVQRKITITTEDNAVRDGVEYNIPIKVAGITEPTTIYDDTLTVTLPGNSSIKVDMKLTRTETITAEWSQINNSNYARTYYVSMSNRFGTVVRESDEITLTFEDYSTNKIYNQYTGFYAKVNGIIYTGDNSDPTVTAENIKLTAITKDTINLEDSAQINQNSVHTTRTKYYVMKIDDRYYLHPVIYNVTRMYPYLDQGLGNQTYKEVSTYYSYTDNNTYYAIPFTSWTAGMIFYEPEYSNGVQQGSNKIVSIDPTHFKFQISVNGDEGAAEISEDGTIIANSSIGLGSNSNIYLEVRMYAKVSGCDGKFSSTSVYDSTYFGEGGSGVVKILLSGTPTSVDLKTADEDISETLIKKGDQYIQIGSDYYLIKTAEISSSN